METFDKYDAVYLLHMARSFSRGHLPKLSLRKGEIGTFLKMVRMLCLDATLEELGLITKGGHMERTGRQVLLYSSAGLRGDEK